MDAKVGELLTTMATNDPAIANFVQESPALAARVDSLVIDGEQSLAEAAEIAQSIAKWKALIIGIMKPVKVAIDEAKRKVLDREKELLALVEAPDVRLRAKVVEFKRLADARERKQKEELRRAAEDEKLKRALRLEEMAEATGDQAFSEAADQALDTPVLVPMPSVAATPKAKGMSFRKVVSVEVTDIRALARAVADGTVGVAAIEPNLTWLKTEARQRGLSYEIPGTVRTEVEDVTVRRS